MANRDGDETLLEFSLHRLRYLQLVTGGQVQAALAYSAVFAALAARHTPGMRREKSTGSLLITVVPWQKSAACWAVWPS